MSTERSFREDFTRNRVVGFAVLLALSLLLLPAIGASPPEAESATAQVAARTAARPLVEAVVGDEGAHRIEVRYEGPAHLKQPVFDALRHERLTVVDEPVAARLVATADVDDGRVAVRYEIDPPLPIADGEDPAELESSSRIGGFEAVMPPLIAILLALFFRRVLLALGLAVWAGGAIAAGGNPFLGLWVALRQFVFESLTATFNLYIIAFTLTLVGMVQIITRMGGIAGLLERFRRFTQTARSARVTTALLGTAIFFDDYANSIVVGTSMRPITDLRRISREKLAYLVDSMSAPVAGVAIISTWIGYEVGLFGEISVQLGLGRSGYDIFFAILPLRFYCLLTIFFVIANAWLGRDYGPMLAAERRAAGGEVARRGSKSLSVAGFTSTDPAPDIPHRWWNAVVPVGLVVIGAIFGMFWSGWSAGDASIPALPARGVLAGWALAAPDLVSWAAWRDAFGAADSAKVLFWTSLLGAGVAFFLAVGQRLLTPRDAAVAFGRTFGAMWLPIAILVLAWSIRGVCDELGTSIYLVGVVGELLAPTALPIVTFMLAALVAFATGTSWGTMGILLPTMVPLAFYLTDGQANAELIVLLCFGAVLDGAIFGDHCSPISDTTVMSSMASSCDHLDHIRTQIPYALTTMVIAGLLGYVGVALGLPPVAALLLGAVAVIAVLLVVGREVGGGAAAQNSESGD